MRIKKCEKEKKKGFEYPIIRPDLNWLSDFNRIGSESHVYLYEKSDIQSDLKTGLDIRFYSPLDIADSRRQSIIKKIKLTL